MSDRPWLDDLHRRLVRQGLPPQYVGRFVGELADHLEDLLIMEDGAVSMDTLQERIGTADDLAEAAVSEYRRRTFFGRHPVWTFLIAPVPAVLVGWIFFMLAALFVFEHAHLALGSAFDVTGKPLTDWPPAMVSLAWAFYAAARFVPPALAAAFFWWLAARSGLSWRWSLAACGLVALVAAGYTSQMVLPVEPGQGRLMVGLGLSLCPTPLQLVQLAVPAAIGLLSAWALGSRGRRAVAVGGD